MEVHLIHREADDPALIDRINEGNLAAFAELYRRYESWVVATAYRRTGNRDDALDVLQETFAYLLRQFPGFVLRANFKTYLYPIIRSYSVDCHRRAARMFYCSEHVEHLANRHNTQAPPTLSPREELATVLDRLHEDTREVLLLRFVDGFTLAEISQAMQTPLGTVKSRLHYALRALREDPRAQAYFQP